VKAWLVTWEWCGDHAKGQQKVAAILNPRFSGRRVREFVEALYINDADTFTLSERLALALDRSKNPYQAQFGRIDGVPWEGRIYCGHNPFLFARLVDGLILERDEHHQEKARWQDCPKPKLQS
jgi:hypothetical protein